MTVETTTVLSGPFTGNGTTTRFPRGFPIDNAAHVVVEVDGAVISTGYTVRDAAQATGDVEFVTAPAVGAVIYLTRKTPVQQDTDYSSQGTVSPEQIERDIDRRTLVEQELSRDKDRSILVPLGQTGKTIPGNLGGNRWLKTDQNGNFIDGGSADEVSNAQSYAQSASNAAVQVAADRTQTGQDRVATAADRVQTGQDRTAVAADLVQTDLDTQATAADRVQTGQDRLATAADRVQTGLDRAAAAASEAQTLTYKNQAEAAITSASAAFANFYGFRVNGSKLVHLKTTLGNVDVSDYASWGMTNGGLTFSINGNGHLVATTL